jgi:hypothetical protein
MASVTAYLPAPDAVALYGVLDECVRRTRGPEESRGMDALRADALVDLIVDRFAQPDPGTRPSAEEPPASTSTEGLADYVIARDQTCAFPSCRIPAHRCDLDHRVPYDPDGGATSADNLGARCRHHHSLKASPGWGLTRETDGTIVWCTPTGHTYEREPYPVGEIDRIDTTRDPA